MILDDARETYRELSGTASSVTRTLGLGGIGSIWILSGGVVPGSGQIRLSDRLLVAGLAFVVALFFDLLQYAVGAAVWGAYARKKEKEFREEKQVTLAEVAARDFDVDRRINWPALACFWIKIPVMGFGYVMLAIEVSSRLAH